MERVVIPEITYQEYGPQSRVVSKALDYQECVPEARERSDIISESGSQLGLDWANLILFIGSRRS